MGALRNLLSITSACFSVVATAFACSNGQCKVSFLSNFFKTMYDTELLDFYLICTRFEFDYDTVCHFSLEMNAHPMEIALLDSTVSLVLQNLRVQDVLDHPLQTNSSFWYYSSIPSICLLF